MAEVLTAAPEHHVALENLHLDPELAPLVGKEDDDARRAVVVVLVTRRLEDEHGILELPSLCIGRMKKILE